MITVINLKGGVGKTHTTWLLAGVCEELGLRCLAVDLDQQGNLTRNLFPAESFHRGTDALFRPGADVDPRTVAYSSKFTHIDIVPAGPALQPLDLTDQREWEKADLHLSLVDFVADVRMHYDFILFDCPTKLSLTGFAALTASDFAIVPLEPADWGAQGVGQVTEAIDCVRSHHNPKLHLLGYLISRYKQRRKYHDIYCRQLREHFGNDVFDTAIPDLAGYEQAVTHAVPPNIRRPTSREAHVARRFFAEVQQRIVQNRQSSRRCRSASVRRAKAVAV